MMQRANAGKLAGLCLAALVLGGARADITVVNGGFEDRDGKKAVGWTMNGLVARDGAGVNGNGGLVFEGEAKGPKSAFQTLKGWQHGVAYTFSALVKCEDFKGRFQLWFEWYDAQGKWISASAADGPEAKTCDWTPVTGISQKIPSNAVSVRIMPYVGEGSTGTLAVDNVSAVRLDRPAVAFVCSTAYRDTAANGEVTFHGAFYPAKEEVDRNRFSAFFTWRDADGAAHRDPAVGVTARQGSQTVDAGRMAFGTQDVVCELFSDGRRIGAATNRFTRVREMPKRRVTFDRHGRCLFDGKPYFPLGMYWCFPVEQKYVDVFKDSPFDCLMFYGYLSRKQIDMLDAAGLRALVTVRHSFLGGRWARDMKFTRQEQVDGWLQKRIDELGDSPALLGWYVNDEAPVTEIPARTGLYRYLREHDPEHPTWCVLDRLHDLREFMPTYDVLGMDPYPIGQKAMEHITEFIRGTREAIFDARPLWNVPQTFNWGRDERDHFPTEEELRSIYWQHLACGANGLIAFAFGWAKDAWGDNVRENPDWKSLCRVAGEVRKMIPVMLSVDPAPTAKADAAIVPVRTWAKDGRVYLLAVNPTRQPLKASVTLSSGTWEIAGTEIGIAPAKTSAGGLSFDFPPLGVSFVRLESTAR